jgi:hypothetical protein
VALDQPGRDRYESLLRHLQAGREIPLPEKKRRGRLGLDIHPVAKWVVALALVVTAGWFIAIAARDYMRVNQVDTWSGPDQTVQSGLNRPGCVTAGFTGDQYFPAWIRFEGKLYTWSGLSTPIGRIPDPDSFVWTGYQRDTLRLYRMQNSPDGREGKRVMVRQGEEVAGAIYILQDTCP